MTKGRLKEFLNLIFKYTSIISTILAIPWIISLIVTGNIKYCLNLMLFSLIPVWIISGILIIWALIGYCVINFSHNREIAKSDKYEREIPSNLSPAIASLLLDFIVEDEQDYVATLSNLVLKGYIEFVDNEKVIVKNENLEGMLEHETLAFNYITKKKEYDYYEFREAVYLDAFNFGFIEPLKRLNIILMNWLKAVLYFLGIPLSIMLFTPWIQNRNVFIGVTVFSCLCVVLGVKSFLKGTAYIGPEYENSAKYAYKKTAKGDEYTKKIAGLRNFFKDYTEMDKKEMESMAIWGEYIPFAIALGEARFIDNVIAFDDKYRKLLYEIKSRKKK